ncbi:Acetylornithine transaminase [Thiorhodococcus drewsii AZ1]|uniref:Acetylornithine transaminase n=1 Tax=Thiorhodococcus drewsii AZ1 TaxID=765913 RepID=G2E6F7_9GAMM|nr:aminotransferase [Thiorhodococcus drewsii]EGV28318.1 Acetylornithine transaminase [Thiorhodococcus drewsii AZ1]
MTIQVKATAAHPAVTTEQISETDKRHTIHPWADLATAPTTGDLVISKGEGYHVYDSDGKRYIDGIAGMWCVNIGYGNVEIAEAIAKQAQKLAYYTPFGAMTNPLSAELARVLAELTPGDLNRVQFTTSGSGAVDSAIRFVHFYFNAIGKPEKKHIISRLESYHGSSYLTASLSGKQVDRTYFHYMDDIIHHISCPNPYRREPGLSLEAYCQQLLGEFEDKINEIGADNIACFIAEPIMGSGGVLVPPTGYHKGMKALCEKYDILYILDEVVTGFGRLGHFFSAEPVWEIIPDLITCAKGITSGYQPMGAVIISDRLFDRISGDNAPEAAYFTNGYTYSGHPITCAAALKNIEIIQRDNICEHVREVGPYFIERLKTLEKYDIVGETRGNHLMACVECNISGNPVAAEDKDITAARTVDKFCDEAGLIVRPYEALLILSPPLVIDKEGIDQLVSILAQSIEQATEELKAKGLI